jgi:hypothetical protein
MGLLGNLVIEYRQERVMRTLYRRAFMVAQCCAEIRLERTFARIEGEPTLVDDARLMAVELHACDVMRNTGQAPVYC